MLFVGLAGRCAHAECMPSMAAVSQSALKHSAAGTAAAFLSGFIRSRAVSPDSFGEQYLKLISLILCERPQNAFVNAG